jgi:hypothetical protein
MGMRNITVDDEFINILSTKLGNNKEISLKKIYALFPDVNRKTISWRLHRLVQEGKLARTGHGYYSMQVREKNKAAGYDYMQKKSRMIYDNLNDYGYNFYISGMDSLVGEILHIPESYPTIVVLEEAGIKEIQELLNQRNLIIATEEDISLIEELNLRNRLDVVLLKGKDFSLSSDHIAYKEKGFIDLYFAVTRMGYSIPVSEISRIYQSLVRNKSIAKGRMLNAAKDRGITSEIKWLVDLDTFTSEALEFMSYQVKEARVID